MGQGTTVLHHKLGVPRRVWMRESLTGDEGVAECTRYLSFHFSKCTVEQLSLRDSESYTENRRLSSTWYRIIEVVTNG